MTMVWALKEAPIPDGEPIAHLVLIGLADHAHDDGTEARPSVATLARYARCSPRTVQNKLRVLIDAGLIRKGDQQTVAHLPSNRRPVVYDLNVGVKEVHPTSGSGVNSRTPWGAQPGNSGVNARADKPSLEPSKEGGERDDVTSPVQADRPTPHTDLGGHPSAAPHAPLIYPERCPAHQVDGYVPPCSSCGVARMTHKASLSNAVRQDAERVRLERLEDARLKRVAIEQCPMCDDTGYAGHHLCDHDPRVRTTYAKGAQAARAALRGEQA